MLKTRPRRRECNGGDVAPLCGRPNTWEGSGLLCKITSSIGRACKGTGERKGLKEEDWHSADLNSSWYGRCVRERLRTCRDSWKIIACISNDGRAMGFFSLSSLPSLPALPLWSSSTDAERNLRLHFTGDNGVYSYARTIPAAGAEKLCIACRSYGRNCVRYSIMIVSHREHTW